MGHAEPSSHSSKPSGPVAEHKPCIAPEQQVPELMLKSVPTDGGNSNQWTGAQGLKARLHVLLPIDVSLWALGSNDFPAVIPAVMLAQMGKPKAQI